MRHAAKSCAGVAAALRVSKFCRDCRVLAYPARSATLQFQGGAAGRFCPEWGGAKP